MATFKVRVLYDFQGEPNTAEMTVTAGEVITVTRTDVGEGWWEGLNPQGVSGLFPEAYVERVNAGPPAMPPPVLPPTWDNSEQQVAGGRYANQDSEDWDDDWDNDDTYSEIQNNGPNAQRSEPNHNFAPHRQPEPDSLSEDNFGADNKGTVSKKSFNRFSTFVKSGGESYILGNLKVHVSESNKIIIKKLDESLYSWPLISNPYTVQVTSPVKETKLGGLKTFVAYQLTPSYSGETVNRRYKQFDWLHERFTEKFNLIAIPPLPDKQIKFDKFEQDFVDRRRVLLQEFVDYVCRHPVLSTCDVWHHFLTRSDKDAWKKGKRQAEKDPLVGANFCLCIEAPDKELLQSWVDDKMDKSGAFIHALDSALKGLMATANDQIKKCQTVYKREYTRIGESFYTLGTAIESEEKAVPSELATAIKMIGTAYFDIGKIFEEQQKIDWEPLSDKLYIYKGITNCFPDILSIQKGAQQKKRECEKAGMVPHQVAEVRKRTDVLTYAIFAEVAHFKNERETDLKMAMKRFLEEQVNFYKKIVQKLEDTLEHFD